MDKLDQGQISTVLLLILTVTAVGVVASTITDIDGIERSGPDISFEPPGSGPDGIEDNQSMGNSSGDISDRDRNSGINLQFCIPYLQELPALVGIVLGVGVVMYGGYRRYNSATMMLLGTGLVPLVWGSYFFLTNCGYDGGGNDGGFFSDGSSVMNNDGGITSTSLPPTVVVGVFAVVMVVGVVTLIRTTGENETFEPVEEVPDEPDEAAFARAAGRAADRIEDANVAVDNAVYRAWLEMTNLLNVPNSETTAPRDFSKGAIAAGLNEDDVSELTELFNEVRYGGMNPEDREERAVEILRSVEQTYQDAETEPRGEN